MLPLFIYLFKKRLNHYMVVMSRVACPGPDHAHAGSHLAAVPTCSASPQARGSLRPDPTETDGASFSGEPG
jgi:hypothetical protein